MPTSTIHQRESGTSYSVLAEAKLLERQLSPGPTDSVEILGTVAMRILQQTNLFLKTTTKKKLEVV